MFISKYIPFFFPASILITRFQMCIGVALGQLEAMMPSLPSPCHGKSPQSNAMGNRHSHTATPRANLKSTSDSAQGPQELVGLKIHPVHYSVWKEYFQSTLSLALRATKKPPLSSNPWNSAQEAEYRNHYPRFSTAQNNFTLILYGEETRSGKPESTYQWKADGELWGQGRPCSRAERKKSANIPQGSGRGNAGKQERGLVTVLPCSLQKNELRKDSGGSITKTYQLYHFTHRYHSINADISLKDGISLLMCHLFFQQYHQPPHKRKHWGRTRYT